MGDIDRGGVFAAVLGTMARLDRSERRRIRGFVINKFRGDQALLTPGIRMIQRRVRRQCSFRHAFIRGARAARGLTPSTDFVGVAAERDERLNRLAAHVEAAVNVDALLGWVGLPSRPLVGVEHHG